MAIKCNVEIRYSDARRGIRDALRKEMTMLRLAILATVTLVASSALATVTPDTRTYRQPSGNYLCTPDRIGGFSLNKQTNYWDTGKFEISKSAYILSKRDGVWTWKKASSDHALPCDGDGFDRQGQLTCGTRSVGQVDIAFSNRSKRYHIFSDFGFLLGGGVEDIEVYGPYGDTPYVVIELGSCSKL